MHTSMAALPSPEESAKAMSDYMAKSHEDKLRAVKAAEDKSASTIKALKVEVEDLKLSRGSSLSAAPADVIAGSRDELSAKLVAYQKFMADYIVKAQEQKRSAVIAAEEATERRFEQKLLLLGGSAPHPKSAVPAPSSDQNKLYSERSANVSAAAKAGKSRWGDLENQRANQQVQQGYTKTVTPKSAASPIVDVPVPPEVEAADHGLRADGGVGGLTLAQRVFMGANAASNTNGPLATPADAAPALSRAQTVFNQRNAMVSAAGKAGKSRWGEMEIIKASEMTAKALPAATADAPASVAPIVPEVAAADHGLRSDGSIGGPTLAERVNLGAQLLQST